MSRSHLLDTREETSAAPSKVRVPDELKVPGNRPSNFSKLQGCTHRRVAYKNTS